MIIYVKAGGQLRQMIKPDIDHYTRKIEIESGKSIGDILKLVPIDPAFVAIIHVDGKIRDLQYVPTEGQTITLQPPVSGG